MEALRRAVNERCLQGIRNSVERTFTTIDNSLSVDRESGTVSFDANHFTSNPVVLTTQNYPSINETVKNLNLQKLNFQRYIQIGHWIDSAIWQIVMGIPWVKWWDVPSHDGVTRNPLETVYAFSGLYMRRNHQTVRDYGVVSDIADILDYIGDEKLYLFSEYGDNTNWARQKYKILNSLKVCIPNYDEVYGFSNIGRPNVMGNYGVSRYGHHEYNYLLDEDSSHPGDPEYNTETESGDGPYESSLNGILSKCKQNSFDPPAAHTGDGASLSTNPGFSFHMITREYDGYYDVYHQQLKTSSGNISHVEYYSGAKTFKYLVPARIDVYISMFSFDYSGEIYTKNDWSERDRYAHNIPDPNPDNYQQYGALEAWNPFGLQNTLNVWQFLDSFELTPDIDFKETIEKLIEVNTSLPSFPTVPNCTEPNTQYTTWRYGTFTGSWIYMISCVFDFEFDFNND